MKHSAKQLEDPPKRRLGGVDVLSAFGGIIIILALLCTIQATWQIWGVNLDTSTVSRQLEKQSKHQYAVTNTDQIANLRDDTPPADGWSSVNGQLLGYMYIPSLGQDWKKPIQQGTTLKILDNMGVGHYADTPFPGQEGNSSYAGHDNIGLFGYLKEKTTPGQQIIVESSSNWYVYQVATGQIVSENQIDVTTNRAVGEGRWLTITTCWPRWQLHPPTRYVVHARMIGWAPKSDGVPEQLAKTTTSMQTKVTTRIVNAADKVNMPISGFLGLSVLAVWLLLDVIAWVISHRRMIRIWREPSLDPLTWMFRLQAGVGVVRVILFIIMWVGITLVCWRWMCPWLSQTIPFLEQPHPDVG